MWQRTFEPLWYRDIYFFLILDLYYSRCIYVSYTSRAAQEIRGSLYLLCTLGQYKTYPKGFILSLSQLATTDDPNQIPVELAYEASYKEMRQLVGRWTNTKPENVWIISLSSASERTLIVIS